MPNDFDCIFFVKKPPTVTLNEGMFHICFTVGKETGVELVMSPHNFLKMRRISAKVVAEFHAAEAGKVETIRKH